MGLKTKSQWNDYKILTKNIEIIPVDESCINKAITKYHDLKEQNNLIELSDLLIAGVLVRVIPVPASHAGDDRQSIRIPVFPRPHPCVRQNPSFLI